MLYSKICDCKKYILNRPSSWVGLTCMLLNVPLILVGIITGFWPFAFIGVFTMIGAVLSAYTAVESFYDAKDNNYSTYHKQYKALKKAKV